MLAFFGVAVASREAGPYIRFGCAATLAVFGLFCLASDTLYARAFLPVSVGLESKAAFLNRMAPDYQTTLFVNSAMAQRKGKALVFFRHVYYLRVPYENGDPVTSWIVNPAVLTDPHTLHAFLKEQDIRWVVKSPNYPDALATIFEECEKEGLLVPEARTDIETLSGDSRVYNIRITVPVTLLRVAP